MQWQWNLARASKTKTKQRKEHTNLSADPLTTTTFRHLDKTMTNKKDIFSHRDRRLHAHASGRAMRTSHAETLCWPFVPKREKSENPLRPSLRYTFLHSAGSETSSLHTHTSQGWGPGIFIWSIGSNILTWIQTTAVREMVCKDLYSAPTCL